MFKTAHGIVGVGGGNSASIDAGARLNSSRVTVAEADPNPKRCGMSDELERTRQLRGDSNEPHRATCGMPEAVKKLYGWRLQILGRMHAALGVREKRSFQMDAERRGTRQGLLLDQRRQSIERKQGAINRGSDERWQPRADAMLRQQVAHVGDAIGSAFHHIVAGGAVHVDIEHGGREQSAGEIVMLGDAAADRRPRVPKLWIDAVLDEQPGVRQERYPAATGCRRLARYACRFLCIKSRSLHGRGCAVSVGMTILYLATTIQLPVVQFTPISRH